MMNFKENKMDWIEEMKAGMRMIKSACKKNGSLNNCKSCPFTNYCDACVDFLGWPTGEPSAWNLEEKENKK